MIIAATVIIYFVTLLLWTNWDSYGKLTDAPLVSGRFVRFLFIHCGSYNENEIIVRGGRASLPCAQNLYTITKSVMIAEIVSFIYAISLILLDIVCLTTENRFIYWFSVPLIVIYFVFAFLLFYLGSRKLAAVNEKRWNEKYNNLVAQENKNPISIDHAVSDYLIRGKKLSFELYDISFEFSAYKKGEGNDDAWQLADKTHDRILITDRDFLSLLTSVKINSKSLTQLWTDLNIIVHD